jgi:hypothetical protein
MTKRIDDDGPKRPPEGYEVASLVGVRRDEVDPTFGKNDKVHGHIGSPRNAPTGDRRGADISAQQGMYLTASGSLIQFNAIMAAIHGSALAIADHTLTKGAFSSALLLHVLAAFVLCWAARPITDAPSTVRGAARAYADNLRHADDTFRNYRRGWRMTLLALIASAAAASLFVLRAFGVSLV